MLYSTLLLTLASAVLSAPTPPGPPGPPGPALPNIPGLPLNLLSLIPKFLANPPPGSCDISKLSLPTTSGGALPAPDAGTKLSLIALGRGTQNYTCASSTAADKPVANGAVANMFNASCLAAHVTSDQLGAYTQAKEKVAKDAGAQFPLPMIGQHFFTDATTPTFVFSEPLLGATNLKKNATAPAPNAAADVAWLKLLTESTGTTGKVVNVYRVNTVSGVPPATCDGLAATFTREYAADYYFYTS